MPASTIVESNGQFRFYGASVRNHDQLPVATYAIDFNPLSGGHSLRKVAPLSPGEGKIYGSHAERVDLIVDRYPRMDRSLGAILSGDKGMGKSLMLRMLAERLREQLGLPTVLVQHATSGLASFLDELGEVAVIFDEFEKVFAKDGDEDSQTQFLSLFDGLSTAKRLYLLSVNDLSRVNEFLLNRPGRLHYHMEFTYPEPETVAAYLHDQVSAITDDQVAEVVEFSRKFALNFDHLRAIALELSLGGEFYKVVKELNIKRNPRGTTARATITWEDGKTTVISGSVDLFDKKADQSIHDYDADLKLTFCLSKADLTEQGFAFRAGDFRIEDRRGEFTKAKEGDLKAAVSLVIALQQSRPLSF
ncbi:ATP-binding protein [Amycolatopsis roodepoortensis]|uniref:ATP-binding protein n=1 Tax=Amycolatopsis roodepoortensis TaxID=700274 RepID=UPI00214B1AB4|nr:ATP-binding protein [Amycolatopsis roodepoortensis]UUV32150.1 ATP-binding protein [Amycolatopsis roodepoortensis]